MAVRNHKPITAGRRESSVADFAEITRDYPEKSLIRPLHNKGGRNSSGRMTTRHQGGGHKRAYRVVDFRRTEKTGYPATARTSEKTRTGPPRIGSCHTPAGGSGTILPPRRAKTADTVENGPRADIKPGNNLPLRNIPVGTMIHAIELRPGGGAKIARSAGARVQLVAKEGRYAQLRMPSTEIRNVDVRNRATVGEVG